MEVHKYEFHLFINVDCGACQRSFPNLDAASKHLEHVKDCLKGEKVKKVSNPKT